MPKPPMIPTAPPAYLLALQQRIKDRAAPLEANNESMMVDTLSMTVYFTGRRHLDITPSTVAVPFSAMMQACANILGGVAAPTFQQGEKALAKAKAGKAQ